MPVYIHDLDPFAIQFTETFGIRWYGLAYIFGFFFVYFVTYRFSLKGKVLIPAEKVGDYIAYLAFGTMIGGRLGYCLFYDPELLVSFSPVALPGLGWEIPMWNALAVWNGGMASHGGIIGLCIACVLFARNHKISHFHIWDITVATGAISIFFGRITNFINGELYGRACEGKCIWPVKFPDEMRRWVSNWEGHKEQLKSIYPVVEKMGTVAGPDGSLISPTSSRWVEWVNASTGSARYYVETYVGRILNAVSKGNEEVLKHLAPYLTERHPSQLYQGFLEGLFVFLFLAWVWRKPQKPGLIGFLWGLTYAIARIIGEQFRMPDAHIGYEWLGLTRGQWLSVAMLLVFVVATIWALRRPVEKIGKTAGPAE